MNECFVQDAADVNYTNSLSDFISLFVSTQRRLLERIDSIPFMYCVFNLKSIIMQWLEWGCRTTSMKTPNLSQNNFSIHQKQAARTQEQGGDMGDGDYCRTLTFSGYSMVFDTRMFPSIATAGCGDAPSQGLKMKLQKGGNNESGSQPKGLLPPLENIFSNEEPQKSGTPRPSETAVESPKEPEEFLLYDYDTEESDIDDSDVEYSDIVESDSITSTDKNKVQQSKERQ